MLAAAEIAEQEFAAKGRAELGCSVLVVERLAGKDERIRSGCGRRGRPPQPAILSRSTAATGNFYQLLVPGSLADRLAARGEAGPSSR